MLNRKIAGDAAAAVRCHTPFQQMAGCIYTEHNNRKVHVSASCSDIYTEHNNHRKSAFRPVVRTFILSIITTECSRFGQLFGPSAGDASAAVRCHTQFQQMAGCIYTEHNNRKVHVSASCSDIYTEHNNHRMSTFRPVVRTECR